MCGRYSLYAPPEEIARVFAVSPSDASRVLAVGPRYNVAPTTTVAAVRQSELGDFRELVVFRWGLIPHWAKEPSKSPLLINARAETVAEKPTFRDSFKNRRCLVIADGFYEWQRLPDRKQPHHFQVDNGALFAFAGIWDRWGGSDGESVESCAIITTRTNELTKLVHDRMPVILSRDFWDSWLGQSQNDRTTDEELLSLLCPFPADRMIGFPVSTVVNSPRNDSLICVEPAGPSLETEDVPC